MLAHPSHVAPPSEDPRWRDVEATMRRHGYRPDALIETLHTVEDAFGYITREALAYVAEALGVPLSKAFGVATFYHLFSLEPPGKHSCIVCLGTACYIDRGPELAAAVEAASGV